MAAPARRRLAGGLRPGLRGPRPVAAHRRRQLRRRRAVPAQHGRNGPLRRHRGLDRARGPAAPARARPVRGSVAALARAALVRGVRGARGGHPRRPQRARDRRRRAPDQPRERAHAQPARAQLRRGRRRPHRDDLPGRVPGAQRRDRPASGRAPRGRRPDPPQLRGRGPLREPQRAELLPPPRGDRTARGPLAHRGHDGPHRAPDTRRRVPAARGHGPRPVAHGHRGPRGRALAAGPAAHRVGAADRCGAAVP
ncbi:hypothetical protein D3C74_337430 [compost metagenome]